MGLILLFVMCIGQSWRFLPRAAERYEDHTGHDEGDGADSSPSNGLAAKIEKSHKKGEDRRRRDDRDDRNHVADGECIVQELD